MWLDVNVCKIKRKANGSIDRYKACLIAKGYNQWEGLDYDATFSPIVKPASVRTVSLSLFVTASNLWAWNFDCSEMLGGGTMQSPMS